MRPAISVAESRDLDKKTIEEIGIPSAVLMERAALGIYHDMINNPDLSLTKTLVLVGNGNNGGDALVVARLLFTHNYPVDILLTGEPDKLSSESKRQLDICRYYQINEVPTATDMNGYSTIVDGLFGSGLTRDVEGAYKELIDKANASSASIHAIDIPSGLNGDTGKPMGTAIKATSTSTIAYEKIGMVEPESWEFTGKIFVDDIGIYRNNHIEN
ncbi:NAD(P)H-hydrate epimerase [Lentilactobacillus sp. SPB1-3]|uniref:NAD(P)H-hydrate epimerase n=1 Tax=Lentilactobacillus terminaliae TaxID=3003483 RepID=A0ACD5DG79_9LACO|nr:NAD(P)H-hydrate epimerase [Lentilactobacillus sp. SPB1-3]MCZ0976578.1 NAD(P)H-hydrate epimerase [Lentilactobacillus sp. SPB1-3]